MKTELKMNEGSNRFIIWAVGKQNRILEIRNGSTCNCMWSFVYSFLISDGFH